MRQRKRHLWRVEWREKGGSEGFGDWQLVRHFQSLQAAQHRACKMTQYPDDNPFYPHGQTRILRSQVIEFEDEEGCIHVAGYYENGISI